MLYTPAALLVGTHCVKADSVSSRSEKQAAAILASQTKPADPALGHQRSNGGRVSRYAACLQGMTFRGGQNVTFEKTRWLDS